MFFYALLIFSVHATSYSGDPLPLSYPVFVVHAELPPMPERDFGVSKTLKDYEKTVVDWRNEAIDILSYNQNRISKMIRDISRRDFLLDPKSSFIQGIPGLGIINDLQNQFTHPLREMPSFNVGPFPVVNVVAEDLEDSFEFPKTVDEAAANGFKVVDSLYANNLTLPMLYELQSAEIDILNKLLHRPSRSAFLQLKPNYIEANPAPYTLIDFSVESEASVDGQPVPLSMGSPDELVAIADFAKFKIELVAIEMEMKELEVSFNFEKQPAKMAENMYDQQTTKRMRSQYGTVK